MTGEAAAGLAQRLPPKAGPGAGPGGGKQGGAALQPEILDRAAIDRALPQGAVHQGIAVLAEPLPESDLDELLDSLAETRSAAILLLDQVTDPQNVGAVLRSAAAFGAAGVVTQRHHAPPMTGTLAKAASGAAEHVKLVRVGNLAQAIERLKDSRFWCVALDGAAEQELAEIDLKGRVALALGAEGPGLRRLTRERCDLSARLPTSGPIADINVSNAAAVALYECARQRAGAEKKGAGK
ncbi:MAG: 23S rRNA (guanosine(2251)-2'-O)-methyltransferase RlmB [Rhodospirillales bacterium]